MYQVITKLSSDTVVDLELNFFLIQNMFEICLGRGINIEG